MTSDDAVLIHTSSGPLAATRSNGVVRAAGIPYATAPTGDARFGPPGPAPAWDDVRDAGAFGAIAPQNPSMMDALFGAQPERWDEDCLHLNVWTPDPSPGAGLPVMVWVHGGGFEMGSGSSPLYDGASFARDGVVLVTFNYRLGAFGFLELGSVDPALAGSGNAGLLDQIAAFRWVRDNIAAFGGDPDDVTAFGQSAGAMSLSLLLSMPAAAGLFDRAIIQSGNTSAARTPEAAAADTAEVLAELDIDPAHGAAAVAALRAADPQRLLDAHAAVGTRRMADPEAIMERTGDPMAFLTFRPVADGDLVPVDPLGRVADGAAAGVDLIVGSTSEEWKLFALATPAPTDDEGLRARAALVVSDPDAAIELYRRVHPDASVGELECELLTDLVFGAPAARLARAQAEHATVHRYRFHWQSPALGGLVGAAHAIELPFVFEMVHDERLHALVGDAAPGGLARALHECWASFARTGAPAADGLADWPAVGDGRQPVMVFDTESALAQDPRAAVEQFWETPAAALPEHG